MKDVLMKAEGDSALLLEFPQEISPTINASITALVHLIREQRIEGIMDMIPAFSSLLIHYEPLVIDYHQLSKRIKGLLDLDLGDGATQKRIFDIPVLYGGASGPDLDFVASQANLSIEEVIEIHSSQDYLIYMLGFLPGFPYLGGLDSRIHTPRLANPRIKIPAGSVGIGGAQTGIYPLDSPGGWQLIGVTPLLTYQVDRKEPILFEAGDYIRFVPITQEEYQKIASEVEAGTYIYSLRIEEV